MSQRYRDVLDSEMGARIVMHRHDRRGEKAPATAFHAGTLGKGMRAAITAVRADYKEMIAAWRAT